MPWTLDRLAPPLGNPPRLFLSGSEQSDNPDKHPSRHTPEVEYDDDGNVLRTPLWSGDHSSWQGIPESGNSSRSINPRFPFPPRRYDRARTDLHSSPWPYPELPRQSARFHAVELTSAPLGGRPGFDPEPGPYFPPRHRVNPLSPTLTARVRRMPQPAPSPLPDRARPSIDLTTPPRNPAPSSSTPRNSALSLESGFRSQPAPSSELTPVGDRDFTPLPPARFSPLDAPVVEERRVASRESQVSPRGPNDPWRQPPPPRLDSSFDHHTGSPLLSFRRTRGILDSLDSMRETHARLSQATALPTSVNTAAHTQALADIDMLRLRITDELVPSHVRGVDLSRARYDRLLPDEVPYVEGSNGERLNREARGEIDSTMDAFRRVWDHCTRRE